MDGSGLLAFLVLFIVIAAAAFGLANFDGITPAVAQAEAGVAIGATTTMALEQVAALVLKLLLGATVTGVALAVFAEVRKAYRAWKRNAQMGRWQGGPNAHYQRQAAEPRLTRQDLMLLALAGRYPADKAAARPRVQRETDQDSDDLDVIL